MAFGHSSILFLISNLGMVSGHHWSIQTFASTTLPIAPTVPTNVLSVFSTSSSGTSPVLSSSVAVGAGTLPSGQGDILVVPVIALSLALGVLLILSCLTIFFCMRRRNPQELPVFTNVAPASFTQALDPRIQVSPIYPVAATNMTSIKPPSLEQHPPQPSSSSQHSRRKLRRQTNPIDAQLPSRLEKVGESVLESQPCSAVRVKDQTSAAALSVESFDSGQDEKFHPEVRDLIVKDNLTKERVMRMKPMKPKRGTILPEYNHKLDEMRPQQFHTYLQDYRILFIVDDSGSMGPHWNDTRTALGEIAGHALQFHSTAVEIRFFNHPALYRPVQGVETVLRIFGEVQPYGSTPTGGVLEQALTEQIQRLDDAVISEKYSSEPLLDIIILTDGVPTDCGPAPVIEKAAKQLKEKKHHPNWIAIQFVQIGNDPNAKPTLLSLIDGPNNDMVGTVSYDDYKAQGNGKLTPAALEGIILGGLHPNLRAYWNQWRQKKYEKTSQVIY